MRLFRLVKHNREKKVQEDENIFIGTINLDVPISYYVVKRGGGIKQKTLSCFRKDLYPEPGSNRHSIAATGV